jgi:serine/threonine protein kinase/DNA-binding beta-propeller fold protein YncE
MRIRAVIITIIIIALALSLSYIPSNAASEEYVFDFKFGSNGSGDGQFRNPRGVAYDTNNNRIIVADTFNHRVQVFDSNGKFLFKFGSNGSGDGQFNYPYGVAYDPNNNRIIVADTANHRVQVFDSNGKFLFKFGSPGNADTQSRNPRGVAYDPNNNRIIVANTDNYRIQVFDSNGKFLFESFLKERVQFVEVLGVPYGVAYDPNNDRIIIAVNHFSPSAYTTHIKVFESEGAFMKSFSMFGLPGSDDGQLNHPTGVAYDPNNNRIIVADTDNHRIQVFDSKGNFLFKFGNEGSGDGQFDGHLGVAYDPNNDRIIVADSYNHRVQVFSFKSSSSTSQQPTPSISSDKPDLTITSTKVNKYEFNVGDTITVRWTESNKGNGNAGPYTVGIYLSTKEYGADFLLQRFKRDGLDANRSIEYTENIRIGNNIPPGSYYLTVFIDNEFTVSESDENNNIGSTTPNKINIIAPKLPPSLTLFDPQIDGLKVTVNGITKPGYNNASINRIQFNWGDGNIEYSWFPATHTYEKEGEYAITVTTYQSDGLTTTSTTTVTLKQELTTGTIQQPQPPSTSTSQPQPPPSIPPTPTVTTQPPTITDTLIPIGMLIGIIAAVVSIPIVIFARRSKGGVSAAKYEQKEPPTPPNFPYELTNKYKPIEHIGEGGFADVFKVKRKSDDKIMALKVPKDKRLKEFVNEVAAWLQLEHKNIVRLYGAIKDPIPHLEIELVDGITINNKIVRDLRGLIEIKNGNNIIDEGKAVSIVRGIAEGLRYAHNNKVYHLDLKPENILITSDYTPKITDFGLAKVKARSSSLSLSTKGLTLLYAAPEQLDNSKYGSSDNRTDIYQLGLIFYELLTGRLPYNADTLAQVISIILDERPFEYVSKHNVKLAKYDHIISKMIAKRKEDRYQSIDGFLSDLNILEKRSIEIEELRKSIEKSKDSIRKSKDPERIKEDKIKIIEDGIKLVNNYIELKNLVELRKELYEIPKYIVVKEELKQKLDNAIKQVDYCIDNRIELSDDFKDKINMLLHEIKMSLLT